VHALSGIREVLYSIFSIDLPVEICKCPTLTVGQDLIGIHTHDLDFRTAGAKVREGKPCWMCFGTIEHGAWFIGCKEDLDISRRYDVVGPRNHRVGSNAPNEYRAVVRIHVFVHYTTRRERRLETQAHDTRRLVKNLRVPRFVQCESVVLVNR
jgi:hypothetical protein